METIQYIVQANVAIILTVMLANIIFGYIFHYFIVKKKHEEILQLQRFLEDCRMSRQRYQEQIEDIRRTGKKI